MRHLPASRARCASFAATILVPPDTASARRHDSLIGQQLRNSDMVGSLLASQPYSVSQAVVKAAFPSRRKARRLPSYDSRSPRQYAQVRQCRWLNNSSIDVHTTSTAPDSRVVRLRLLILGMAISWVTTCRGPMLDSSAATGTTRMETLRRLRPADQLHVCDLLHEHV